MKFFNWITVKGILAVLLDVTLFVTMISLGFKMLHSTGEEPLNAFLTNEQNKPFIGGTSVWAIAFTVFAYSIAIWAIAFTVFAYSIASWIKTVFKILERRKQNKVILQE